MAVLVTGSDDLVVMNAPLEKQAHVGGREPPSGSVRQPAPHERGGVVDEVDRRLVEDRPPCSLPDHDGDDDEEKGREYGAGGDGSHTRIVPWLTIRNRRDEPPGHPMSPKQRADRREFARTEEDAVTMRIDVPPADRHRVPVPPNHLHAHLAPFLGPTRRPPTTLG